MNIGEQLAKLAGVHIYFDKALVFAGVALIVIGYLMVSSASLHLGAKLTGDVFHYPFRQFIHICLGVMAGFFVCLIPMAVWEKAGPALFVVGLIFLVIVLIPGVGVKVNGSMRWLSVIGIRIQVSELVKLIVVIYMASFVTRHHDFVKESAYGLVKPLFLLSSACGLLLLEPDMGSAVVILTIAMGVMFLSGARLQQFILLIVAVISAGILAKIPVYVKPLDLTVYAIHASIFVQKLFFVLQPLSRVTLRRRRLLYNQRATMRLYANICHSWIPSSHLKSGIFSRHRCKTRYFFTRCSHF